MCPSGCYSDPALGVRYVLGYLLQIRAMCWAWVPSWWWMCWAWIPSWCCRYLVVVSVLITMINCFPLYLLVSNNYNKVWGFSLLLRGNFIIGCSLLLREMCIRLGCSPWLIGIAIHGCYLSWIKICIMVSLLLRVATRVSLWLIVANRGRWIQASTFASLLWRVMVEKCCTLGCHISVNEGVSCSSEKSRSHLPQ